MLFWSIFSCPKVPEAAGYGGHCGTQLATPVLVLHTTSLAALVHPRPKPNPAPHCPRPDPSAGCTRCPKGTSPAGEAQHGSVRRAVAPPGQPSADTGAAATARLAKVLPACNPHPAEGAEVGRAACPQDAAVPARHTRPPSPRGRRSCGATPGQGAEHPLCCLLGLHQLHLECSGLSKRDCY